MVQSCYGLSSGTMATHGTDSGEPATLRYEAAPRRRDQIMDALRQSGHVSVAALSEQLAVSEMTVRRDLRQLAKGGDVVVVHGGASMPPGWTANPAFTARASVHAEVKHRIGAAAAQLVPTDSTVGIDAGTTTLHVALALPDNFAGAVVTHSVPVLAAMLARPCARVLAIGGELFHDNQALIGPSAASSIADLRLRTLMLGVTALDARGVYVRSELELAVKRALIDASDEVVLVSDVSKQEASGTVRVCGLDRIDTIVTDGSLRSDIAEQTRRNGSRVVVA